MKYCIPLVIYLYHVLWGQVLFLYDQHIYHMSCWLLALLVLFMGSGYVNKQDVFKLMFIFFLIYFSISNLGLGLEVTSQLCCYISVTVMVTSHEITEKDIEDFERIMS